LGDLGSGRPPSSGKAGKTPPFDSELVLFRDVTVKEILDKQRTTKVLSPMTMLREGDTVAAAIAEMSNRDISAVVVQDDHGNLTGLFTESDFMRMCASRGAVATGLTLREAISNKFVWVHEGSTALEVMRVLCDTRFRHIPVCDPQGKTILGIISIDDLVKLIASERSRAVEFYRDLLVHVEPSSTRPIG